MRCNLMLLSAAGLRDTVSAMASAEVGSFYRSVWWRRLRRACLQRDRWVCTVAGCRARATTVDHIETRPREPHPTALDHLGNLRSLCATHDAQVKETAAGARRRGGLFVVRGVDQAGWPRDPSRGG